MYRVPHISSLPPYVVLQLPNLVILSQSGVTTFLEENAIYYSTSVPNIAHSSSNDWHKKFVIICLLMLDCQMQKITFTLRKTNYKGEGPWRGLHELYHYLTVEWNDLWWMKCLYNTCISCALPLQQNSHFSTKSFTCFQL